MGRRKERRLAAMSGGGRRVKLDLFAEPSGDLGGSSDQNEVGGNDDGTKNQAGLPNSPSTSGQQLENPLVLLGQYSDDELDEESSGEQVQAVSGDTSVTIEHQEKIDTVQGNEDLLEEENTSGSLNAEHHEMDNPLQLLESLRKTEVDCPTNNHVAESGVIPEETSLKEQASATFFPQAVGDVILGWKVVLHEGSNQYYYWNTATGETSWEVPDILAQASESADGKRETADGGKKEIVTGTLDQSTEVNERNSCEPSMEVSNEECRGGLLGENTDLEQSQLKGSSCPNGTLNHATLPGSNIFVSESNNWIEDDVNGIESVMSETGELASSLVKCGEHLLEQLNSVTRSKCNMQGYNLILKYVSEIETRLADMKSLGSYGSSLLPFWLHSQKQLQKLEIDVRDALQSLESGQLKEVGTEDESRGHICNVSETNSIGKNVVCSSGDSRVRDSSETTKLQKNEMEVYSQGVSSTEVVSSNGCLTTYTDINLGGKAEGDGIVEHFEATPKSLLPCAEEIDMDIDMEVEDTHPTSICTVADPAQHHIPLEESAVVREMCSIPPPPEEDWIPPPPPDAEPFPPPPPDEPPEILYSQAPDVESTNSFSYAEQYMSYNGPIYGYYAQANTDFPGSNLYVTAEASQPTLSHPPMYFEPVPNGYPATLAVNPVEPSGYYTFQDQHPIESSVSHSSTIPKTSISEAMGPLHTHVEVESASLPKEVKVPSVDGDSKKATLEIQSSQAVHQDLATPSVAVSVSSVPAATAPVASTTTKTQSKVMRAKKKSITSVSSLRSNKKVSCMVDKWKAAKEELQEEEEEPRSALEILEKKKQREIEGWYAQQIASGEAKDNANFQPLGGDWRERVKRKRARLASELSEASADTVTEGNQPPNLEEVTRGLPNGWQAYWDNSSKQVYYGNSVTSETTWVRPTS